MLEGIVLSCFRRVVLVPQAPWAEAVEYPMNKVKIAELKTTGRELSLVYVTEPNALFFTRNKRRRE